MFRTFHQSVGSIAFYMGEPSANGTVNVMSLSAYDRVFTFDPLSRVAKFTRTGKKEKTIAMTMQRTANNLHAITLTWDDSSKLIGLSVDAQVLQNK